MAKEWGSVDGLISIYKSSLEGLQATIEAERGREWVNARRLQYALVPVMEHGRNLASWVLQTRSIPPREAKSLELVSRLLGSIRRMPRDILAWWDKNNARLWFLLKASKWAERSEDQGGAPGVVKVGPFTIHNTIGVDYKLFGNIKALVEAAVRSISTTLDFKKVLYGDVYIVGQLKDSRTLAWYAIKDDDVFVRSMAKKGHNDLRSLIHELGHRYWFKFMSRSAQDAVRALYHRMLNQGNSKRIEMPKIGEPLPVPIRGQKEPPIVTNFDGGYFHLSTGGRVKFQQVFKIMRQLQVVEAFPSAYAATKLEEFFAECFAFYVMGELSEGLAQDFEAALK